jgi:hypothetical protein
VIDSKRFRRGGACVLAALVLAVCCGPRSARADLGEVTDAATADVLIQAGHEGRPDCDREPLRLCNNTGAVGEMAWTPVVADEATRILRAAGVTVIRRPAYLHGQYHVKDAVFLHFDGNAQPCGSGASVGYPVRAHSPEAAAAWKALYGASFPFRFQPDNFTVHLAQYYGFDHVRDVSDAAFVIEWGEVSCPAQHAWLGRRLAWEGALLAYFLARRLGNTSVPLPAAPSSPAEPKTL